MPGDDKPIDKWLVSLYYALKPEDIDLQQLGAAEQHGEFSAPPFVNVRDLAAHIDLNVRQERYAANLTYVLGTRMLEQDEMVGDHLATLGATILQRVGVGDPESGEQRLRTVLRRIAEAPRVTDEVVNAFRAAFKGAFDAEFDGAAQTWNFTGPAAETATMMVEMASMQMNCQGREGRVRVGRRNVPVTVIEYEACTQSPFSRTAPGVDPRNWTIYNPFFFDSIEVLTPAPAASANQWNGVIQETVGALMTGNPVVTNLAVSYVEQPGLAAVTYDLAPKDPSLKDDDNTVTVDYGVFAVMEEGVHRRVRMKKVVHIEGHGMNHEWLCPLWAQQNAMIGWWF
jgi:hypothetical protein